MIESRVAPMRNALVKMLSLVWEVRVETGEDNATWQGYGSHGDMGSGCWRRKLWALIGEIGVTS